MYYNNILSVVLSIQITILIDYILVIRGIHFKTRWYILSIIIQTLIILDFDIFTQLHNLYIILIMPTMFYLVKVIINYFSKHEKKFLDLDNGKKLLYGNKKVLVIVPHQDDEINLLGGIYEEYLKYSSEIYIVYVITNGNVGGFRFKEAINWANHIGIPKNNIIFLGNVSLTEIQRGINFKTKGIDSHSAYKEGQEFSRENIVNNLFEIVNQIKPDIIYGSDYDYHIDHHLVSICIDECLGRVLKSDVAYKPLIFKGYAYRTTWESYPDFYKLNLLSTIYKAELVETFEWDKRLRLPINPSILSRSLLNSEIFRQYSIFKSQGAIMRAIRFNTDKIVWKRNSDSCLINAEVIVSSGDGSKLNDFLLYDKTNLNEREQLPLEGAWIPNAEDKEKIATFILKQTEDIKYIILYNNLSAEHRVKTVSISFNDKRANTFNLNTDNVYTYIHVNEKKIYKISIQILETTGIYAGFTEVEAISNKYNNNLSFIKIMNENNDFLYDYWINRKGEESFLLYNYGQAKPFSKESYYINTSNNKSDFIIEENKFIIRCPKNEKTIITVFSKDNQYSDTIMLSNPNNFKRLYTIIGQKIESLYYDIFIGDFHRKATTLSLKYKFKQYAEKIICL